MSDGVTVGGDFLVFPGRLQNTERGNNIMITRNTVKKELESIRYYYARCEVLEKAFDSVGKNSILEIINKYNATICTAPVKIYELYVALYVQGCTYEKAAEILGYSVNYVYKSNMKIVDFFHNALNKKEVA